DRAGAAVAARGGADVGGRGDAERGRDPGDGRGAGRWRARRRRHPADRAGAGLRARDAARPRAARTAGAAARHALPGTGGLTMAAKHLVIVESPAKAKTLGKYLGRDYQVKASIGHVVDLPKSKLGVDVENDFETEYTVIHGKNTILNEIKQAAKDKDTIYLAPDPDREGEAIAWHIARKLGHPKRKNVRRVLFNEITKKAVLDALKHPRDLDQNLFEAQQARRVLDRLVGYRLSPLLWDKVRRGLSAGRVQSVAVRIIVEREREITVFVPEEYWTVEARLEAGPPPLFTPRLAEGDGQEVGQPPKLDNRARVDEILHGLEGATWTVAKIEKKERRRHPTPPFITSRLQQEASRKLGFQPSRTMRIAQRLYEGVELGEEGAVGLITYMRTDST